MSDTQHSAFVDLQDQPPAARAAHYRELADMHLQAAQTAAASEARASHLELAALWTRLAAQADHQPADPLESAPDPAQASA